MILQRATISRIFCQLVFVTISITIGPRRRRPPLVAFEFSVGGCRVFEAPTHCARRGATALLSAAGVRRARARVSRNHRVATGITTPPRSTLLHRSDYSG